MKLEFSQIQGLEKLAKGGQGVVYRAPAGAISPQLQVPVAIKKYSKKVLTGNEESIQSYLRILIQFQREAPEDLRKLLGACTVWPWKVVYENGTACGFVMRLIPEKYTVRYQGASGEKAVTSTFDFILNSDEVRRNMGLPIISPRGRARIALLLLYILTHFHQADLVIGDISPNNILVCVDPQDQARNQVLFIDADSFRKKGHTHPLRQPHTPNWFPPESWTAQQQRLELEQNQGDMNQIMRCQALEYIQNTQTDVYKICLAILRLYHLGDQRSSVSESPEALRRMEAEVGQSFALRVSQGLDSSPQNRPPAQALLRAFLEDVRRKQSR